MFASMLEVDEFNTKNSDKLNDIKDWVKSKSESDDPMELMRILKDVKFRIGAPRNGESKLDQVHRYIKLRRNAEMFNAQAKEMEL